MATKKAARISKPLKRAAKAVKKKVGAAKNKLRTRRKTKKPAKAAAAAPPPSPRPRKVAQKAARPAKREADIPIDRIEETYSPKTSVKTGFRSDGRDRQSDQGIADVGDGRWNDEDRFTNKSGDPRIGTHGRTYEPAEKKRKIDYESE